MEIFVGIVKKISLSDYIEKFKVYFEIIEILRFVLKTVEFWIVPL